MAKFSVILLSPHDGRSIHPGTAERIWCGSDRLGAKRPVEKMDVAQKGGSGYHFNELWCHALNAAQEGLYTHACMLHADIEPMDRKPRWIDILLDICEEKQASFVSVAMAIKSHEGLVSSGFGVQGSPWKPYKRFTLHELYAKNFPRTFNLEEAAKALGQNNILAEPERFHLLHNSGMWIADLRKDCWYHTDENGHAVTFFNFPECIVRVPAAVEQKPEAAGFVTKEGAQTAQLSKKKDQFIHLRESEDWYFSRKMAEAGIRDTYITTIPKAIHHGDMDFVNTEAWGELKNGDENTAYRWREDMKKPVAEEAAKASS